MKECEKINQNRQFWLEFIHKRFKCFALGFANLHVPVGTWPRTQGVQGFTKGLNRKSCFYCNNIPKGSIAFKT